MKCMACNYEHNDVNSNIPFKEIFTSNHIGIRQDLYSDGYSENGVYYAGKRINLFACPMCGTVRLETI